MQQPTRTLPDGYKPYVVINLAKDIVLAVILNAAAILGFFACTWLLKLFSGLVHPELAGASLTEGFGLLEAFGLLILTVIILVVHEVIHGLFFYIITHSKPVYGISLTYAFAAAPAWYIPKWQYVVIGLAPLVLIGIAGAGIITFGPTGMIVPAIILTAINTAGAVGDIWIISQVLSSNPGCLVNDTGHQVTLFQE